VASVPFVRQVGTEDCGATAAAIVLAHAGRPVPRADLERELVRPSVGGSFTFDLALALRRRDLYPVERRGLGLDDLRAWLRAGRPPIALLAVAPTVFDRKHFVVVTGIDDGRGLVLLHDGAAADTPYAVDDFLARWNEAGAYALVAVPPAASLPRDRRLLGARERARVAVLADRAGAAGAALEHYRAALALDPAHDAARANLGRLLLVLGRPAEAERELRVALAGSPADVRARNNLAHALIELASALPAGPARAVKLAEAELLAGEALRRAPPELVAVCRDTLERARATWPASAAREATP
jgi:tetratricopeptide (TPR) repeat protein